VFHGWIPVFAAVALNALELRDCPFVHNVPGVQSCLWLDEHDVYLLIGGRAVFNSARHDDELALADDRLTVAEFHAQRTFCYQKQLILVFVMVPDKFSRELDGFEVTVVHFTYDARIPMIRKLSKFVFEIDCVHELTPD